MSKYTRQNRSGPGGRSRFVPKATAEKKHSGDEGVDETKSVSRDASLNTFVQGIN